MKTTASASSLFPSTAASPVAAVPAYPWLLLVSRSALFVLIQLLLALGLAAAGTPSAWDESSRYWAPIASLANVASLYLLVRVFRSEGKRFWDILRFSRQTWKADVLWFIGLSILGMPIAAVARDPLAAALFGDPMTATTMMFQPLPLWVFVLSFLFPFTIWFAELPTYFGYVMPRLAAQLKKGWLAWLIASFFLAAQHMFLPLIFDGRYLLWRLGMFLPFALFTGLVLKYRPSLLPYFVIVHALMDVTTVLVYVMIPGLVV